jgi:acyl carrier protein
MSHPEAPMDPALREKIDKRCEILQGIKEELIERLELDMNPDDIDDDAYLFGGGLQLDSIDSMEIIIGIQSRFGAEIPEGDMSPLRTINTLADFVQAHPG